MIGRGARPGDLILVRRGDGAFDRLVRFATVSPYFHVAIVEDSATLVEAAMGGVRRDDLHKYDGRSDLRSPQGATAYQRQQAVKFCWSRVGLGYGWGDIVADALRLGLHVPTGYRWRRWQHFDCSCLVAAAWATAGLPLTLEPAPTPASLGWSALLRGPAPWREIG